MGHVRVNGGNSGVNGLSQKSIKLFHDRKDSSKRSEFFGFYCYLCHVCYDFPCLWIRNTKVSENSDMAKTWATKCCPGTYKNNYQLCCGIKDNLTIK